MTDATNEPPKIWTVQTRKKYISEWEHVASFVEKDIAFAAATAIALDITTGGTPYQAVGVIQVRVVEYEPAVATEVSIRDEPVEPEEEA